MKTNLLGDMFDGMADEGDHVEVEIQPEMNLHATTMKVYIHVNGVTIARFCKIRPSRLTVRNDERTWTFGVEGRS